MIVSKAIYNILSNHTGLTDLVGTRIYPVVAAQQAALPYVVFDVPRTEPVNRTSGKARMNQIQVNVSAFATRYDDACSIAEQVKTALDRVAAATYNGVVLQVVLFADEYNIFHDEDDTHEIQTEYRVSLNTGAAA